MVNEIERMCAEISNEIVTESWYGEVASEIISTRKEICEQGGIEIKNLLNRYDELCLRVHCAIEEKICAEAVK